MPVSWAWPRGRPLAAFKVYEPRGRVGGVTCGAVLTCESNLPALCRKVMQISCRPRISQELFSKHSNTPQPTSPALTRQCWISAAEDRKRQCVIWNVQCITKYNEMFLNLRLLLQREICLMHRACTWMPRPIFGCVENWRTVFRGQI